MRRIITLACSLAPIVAAAWAMAVPFGGAAQDAASRDGHPLVGTWFITSDPSPDAPPDLVIFGSDGTFQQLEAYGSIGFGVWEATGPNTANLTFSGLNPDESGDFAGTVTIRAAITVAEDGKSLTATYTVQFVFKGEDSGELGPGTVTGTRMVVEPMGTPVSSFDDFEEEAATPAG